MMNYLSKFVFITMNGFIVLIFIVLFIYLVIANYRVQKLKDKNDLSGNLDKQREDYKYTILGFIDEMKKQFTKKTNN